MQQLIEWLEAYGGLGLFLAAALDAFIPLTHVVDPMVVYLSHAERDPFSYAALAVAGSTLGTTVLFLLVRSGGQRLVRGRLTDERHAQVEAMLERYGVLGIVIAGVMPPPFPFKAVLLGSALMRMSRRSFILGMLVSRSFRYGLEAALGFRYGGDALGFLTQHYAVVGLTFIAMCLGAWVVAQRMLTAPAAQPAD